MSQRDRRRTQIGGQFAPRLIEMLRSPAYRVLSLSAHRVLARIEIEFADHGGTENGRLPVTYADFAAYGLDRHSIAPAIRELETLGFIEVTERGRAGNADFRTPSLYRLTFRETDRAAPTHEWRQIDTREAAEALAVAARRASEKQKTSGGKSRASVWETTIENRTRPVGRTHTTGLGENPPLLSIYRAGGR